MAGEGDRDPFQLEVAAGDQDFTGETLGVASQGCSGLGSGSGSCRGHFGCMASAPTLCVLVLFCAVVGSQGWQRILDSGTGSSVKVLIMEISFGCALTSMFAKVAIVPRPPHVQPPPPGYTVPPHPGGNRHQVTVPRGNRTPLPTSQF